MNRWNRKKLKMKTLKTKIRKTDPPRPTDEKSERLEKNFK